MSTLSTILAAVLGVVFVAVGIQKVTGEKRVVANFERWGFADVVRTAIGWLEILTGTLLLVGIAVPALAVTGSLLIIMIMIGALATHQRAHDGFAMWSLPVVLLAIDLVLAYSLLP
jgi:putative oxidoreductase